MITIMKKNSKRRSSSFSSWFVEADNNDSHHESDSSSFISFHKWKMMMMNMKMIIVMMMMIFMIPSWLGSSSCGVHVGAFIVEDDNHDHHLPVTNHHPDPNHIHGMGIPHPKGSLPKTSSSTTTTSTTTISSRGTFSKSSSTTSSSSKIDMTAASSGRNDDSSQKKKTTTTTTSSTAASSKDTCGIWLAPSTIPGAGLGMFAGRDYQEHDLLGSSGDVVIPIVDFKLHQKPIDNREWTFLWDEYTWDAIFMKIDHEGVSEVNLASPGFGAAANCILDLQNVEEWYANSDHILLDRRYDPGAGAFSIYHDRKSTAKSYIQAGEELFVSYGDNWFVTRPYMGPIPIFGDLDTAYQQVYQPYIQLKQRYDTNHNNNNNKQNNNHKNKTTTTTTTTTNSSSSSSSSTIMWNELWKTMIVDTVWTESRVMGAFSKERYETELEQLQPPPTSSPLPKGNNNNNNNNDNHHHPLVTLKDLRKRQATRDMDWIRTHGVCCDNLREGVSNFVQAGRGAYSTRFLSKGSVVAPLPMIHIPYDRRLDMYAITKHPQRKTIVLKQPKHIIGKQLLLNYCYGHPESTMLLCPYGMYVGFINHNQTLANVRLQWSDPNKSSHRPNVLNETIESIDHNYTSSTVLSMDFIALRDIEEGEEIFLDYGNEWEEAWHQHLQQWKPYRYTSPAAGQWNDMAFPIQEDDEDDDDNIDEEGNEKDKTTKTPHRFRTEFEQMKEPYPGNIELKCNKAFRKHTRDNWQPLVDEQLSDDLYNYARGEDGLRHLQTCELLRVRHDESTNQLLYTALLTRLKEDEANEDSIVMGDDRVELMEDVPRQAFYFLDRPYNSDMFLPDAFRHAIMIPDDIFPEAWKNRAQGGDHNADDEDDDDDDNDNADDDEEDSDE